MGNQQASPPPTPEPEPPAPLREATDEAQSNMDLSSRMSILNMKTKKNINILLLGETGIGKSTFINSVFNYLHYQDFEKAESDGKLTVLIPTLFTISDKKGVRKEVMVGSETDKNEFLSIGESATQDVKTYMFKLRDSKTMVRLIDTPGMGDTNGGLEKDNAHCENILSYISGLNELQAICFLFKPKTTRLNAFFKYCMDQILSRLDKSASKNLVFVFTNTRGDNYTPGDTYSVLQRVVREIGERPPYAKIPFNVNVFCFDNEPFRYLAAVKDGVEFDESFRACCKESWEKSTKECWRMIQYVDQLKPHLVQQTSAINEARRMIFQLSQPMAEIAQVINDNLYVLENHQKTLSMDNQSLAEMKKKLYIPVVSLKVITLSQPVTVCTDSTCAELYKVEEVNKWHYKQRCHDPCYLQNVPKEIVGSPELVNCAAMNRSTQICDRCSHRYTVHMHIYYMTETFQEEQIDETVAKSINTKEMVLENARKVIKNIETKKRELEDELKVIIDCNAQFAHFLQHNAITPFSDSYEEYINHLIIREKSLGSQANQRTLKNFEQLLMKHKMMKAVFDQALKDSVALGNADLAVTPEKIRKSTNDLYSLKHNGKKIKELYESQNQSRKKEHAQLEEYVHAKAFSQSVPEEKKEELNAATSRNTRTANNQAQIQRGGRSYNHHNNRNHRSRSGGPNRRRSSPPPSYDSSTNNRGHTRNNPTPQNRPRGNYRPPPQPPAYNTQLPHHASYVPAPAPPVDPSYYSHRPAPEHPINTTRYSSSGSDESNSRTRTEPTSIQVNLTLPQRDSAASAIPNRAEDPHYRGAHYPPHPPPSYAEDPYYHHPDRRYSPRDPYTPRDSQYPPREPYYRPPRDDYYPPGEPYPPRDGYNPPRDQYRRREPLDDPYYHREPYYPPAPPRDPFHEYPPRPSADSYRPPPPGYQHEHHYAQHGYDRPSNASQRGGGYNQNYNRGRRNFNRAASRGGRYTRRDYRAQSIKN